MRRFALALLLLVLPFPPADAQPDALEWRYVLAPDPARGLVRVEVRLDGMEGVVTRFTFATADRSDAVTNVTAGPATDLRLTERGFEVRVDGPESFAYDVDVRQPAFREGERLAHAGPDFVLFKAEAVALAHTFEYYEGRLRPNRTTVALAPPPGWSAAAPWESVAPLEFRLLPDVVVPRGFVAFGAFDAWENRTVAGTHVQLVRIGHRAPFEPDLWTYLERATPYMEAVYGRPPGDRLLLVTTPDPMLRGGLGAFASMYVHETATLATVAHEHAHVHQRFHPREDAGRSGIWFNEGDADWRSALALHAAGYWTPTQVNEFFRDAERDRFDPVLRDARLPDATYGGELEGRSLERFAYHKGMLVLRALDARLRDATNGSVGVPDLLRRLNEVHGAPAANPAPLDTSDVAIEASRLAGEDLSAFFGRYVLGTEWPDAPPYAPAGSVEVVALRLDPPAAIPGASILVEVDVVNAGTQPVARPVDVRVGGHVAVSLDATLGVGEARTLRATLVAPPPGEHEVQALDARATLRSLAPARLAIGNVTVVPVAPRAGEPFDLVVFVDNAGEVEGRARLGAWHRETSVGGADVVVPPRGTSVATIPLRLEEAGNATLRLELDDGRDGDAFAETIHVRPADARRETPLATPILLAALAGAALASGRKK